MTYGWTDEQLALRDTVANLCGDFGEEYWRELDWRREYPAEFVKALTDAGLLAVLIPEEYGGGGGSITDGAIILETINRSGGTGVPAHAQMYTMGTVLRHGSEEQKQRWLPELCRGEKLGAFGLTEPGGGSDVFGTARTRAVQDGDEWVIDGAKQFITNAGTEMTSVVTVTAWTAEREMTAIIVPIDTPGVSIAPPYHKVGWHASDTRELTFDGVRVPVDNTLGERGAGFRQFLKTLDDGRIAIAALAVGLIQGCVDECVRYANEREAFGGPIGKQQAIAFKIADLEVAAQTARQMYRYACRRKLAGLPYKREAAIAKLYSSEQAVTAAREATQIFGGMGFTTETRVGRFYQDAKILEIGEGTSEVQRMLISRDLGL